MIRDSVLRLSTYIVVTLPISLDFVALGLGEYRIGQRIELTFLQETTHEDSFTKKKVAMRNSLLGTEFERKVEFVHEQYKAKGRSQRK
ncbi:hypothetical protein PTKIN_Ptkin02bG0216500 [Pterospermum kingtungense]